MGRYDFVNYELYNNKFKNAKKVIPEKNQILEDFYKNNKKPTDTDVKQLSFDLGSDKWNERKIQRWFRHRRNLK